MQLCYKYNWSTFLHRIQPLGFWKALYENVTLWNFLWQRFNFLNVRFPVQAAQNLTDWNVKIASLASHFLLSNCITNEYSSHSADSALLQCCLSMVPVKAKIKEQISLQLERLVIYYTGKIHDRMEFILPTHTVIAFSAVCGFPLRGDSCQFTGGHIHMESCPSIFLSHDIYLSCQMHFRLTRNYVSRKQAWELEMHWVNAAILE